MNYIVITDEENNMIKGVYKGYAGLAPLLTASGYYIFPEACMTDPAFAEISDLLQPVIVNTQDITKASDVTDKENTINWSSIQMTLTADDNDLYAKLTKYTLITYFILSAGTYKATQLFYNNTDTFKTLKGSGDVLIKGWDFTNSLDKRIITLANFSNLRFENLTIRNLLINHKDWTNLAGRKLEFVDVQHEVTIQSAGGYLCYLFCPSLEINITNYTLIGGDNIYAGIWFLAGIVTIDGCKISGFDKPYVMQGVESLNIKNVHTIGGITGIFHGGNKSRPLDNFIIEDCIAEGASEECISFDTYGNNVSLNPCIAELAITSVIDAEKKIYCTSRIITGTHPDEVYEDYTFVDHEAYLERFYVYFSQESELPGYVAKITDVGIDETGEFIVIDTDLDLTLLSTGNYKALSIMGGFFNGIIRNNTIRNGKWTGLALFCSCFNNQVYGNVITNCPNGSYLHSKRMLALGVYNSSCGNTITGNNFEDGFEFGKYSETNAIGYDNTYTDNTGPLVPVIGEERFITDEI